MGRWKRNIYRVFKENNVGECPYCNSKDTDYVFHKHEDGKGNLNVWCNSCSESIHVDLSTVPDDKKIAV